MRPSSLLARIRRSGFIRRTRKFPQNGRRLFVTRVTQELRQVHRSIRTSSSVKTDRSGEDGLSSSPADSVDVPRDEVASQTQDGGEGKGEGRSLWGGGSKPSPRQVGFSVGSTKRTTSAPRTFRVIPGAEERHLSQSLVF